MVDSLSSENKHIFTVHFRSFSLKLQCYKKSTENSLVPRKENYSGVRGGIEATVIVSMGNSMLGKPAVCTGQGCHSGGLLKAGGTGLQEAH